MQEGADAFAIVAAAAKAPLALSLVLHLLGKGAAGAGIDQAADFAIAAGGAGGPGVRSRSCMHSPKGCDSKGARVQARDNSLNRDVTQAP